MAKEEGRTKFFIIAHVPERLERDMLQHIRNFDSRHSDDVHFEIGIDGPERTLHEMIDAMRINPALTFTQIFERAKHEGTPAQRAKLVNDLALEVARYRMADTLGILKPEEIVREEDIAFALRFIRLCAPLHPLPEQHDLENRV